MGARILITGSEGLVGSSLVPALRAAGFEISALDLRGAPGERGDTRDAKAVSAAMDGCTGVVHLAAVSRVVWGERDPARCWSINVDGTRVVLAEVDARRPRPWMIFVSSREVYGEARSLPVTEDAPLRPLNAYGRTKVVGERLVHEARGAGTRTAVVRLSNVYGSLRDHADRVVPAFARGALLGRPLRVEGPSSMFDFTHVEDAVRGLVRLSVRLEAGDRFPDPIHLVTGAPTTLQELAGLAIEVAGTDASVEHYPPRTFDAGHFIGDPTRAREVLGWTATVPLRLGLSRLISEMRDAPELVHTVEEL